VILTSPTYEGLLSETEEICRICHARGIPVLVDEAHGAHLLALSEAAGFPPGALAAGADLVVQSPHKTLPSLTQTALLHLKGGLVDPLRVEEELDYFETSSPSYPLMASLDGCTGILVEQGAELFQKWAERLDRFDRVVENRLHRLRILGRGEDRTPAAGHRSLDPGKILIDAAGAGMTGLQLAAVLREKYRMETEMQQGPLVLVMTSICDEEDALDRLARALLEIDAGGAPADRTGAAFSASDLRPRVYCAPGRAAALEKEEVPFSDACGRICAEYLYYYPPGIPFLAPGEVITRKILTLVEDLQAAGQYPYRHPEGLRTIRCLRD
jgi:arginine/lysine/ornithine decarboxylase